MDRGFCPQREQRHLKFGEGIEPSVLKGDRKQRGLGEGEGLYSQAQCCDYRSLDFCSWKEKDMQNGMSQAALLCPHIVDDRACRSGSAVSALDWLPQELGRFLA